MGLSLDARTYDATRQHRIGSRFGLVAVVVGAAVMSAAGLTATAIELNATVRPAGTPAHGVAVGLSTRIRSGPSIALTSPTLPPPAVATSTTTTQPATGPAGGSTPPSPTSTTTVPGPTTTTLPAPTTTTTTLPAPTTTTTQAAGGTGAGSEPAPGAPQPSPTMPVVTTTTVPPPATTTTTQPAAGSGSGPKPLAAVVPTAPPVGAAAAPNKKSRCKPDPAGAIAALPAGGVFNGSGCYKTAGILITKPVTINGGIYDDHVNAESKASVNAEGATDSVEPIFRIKDTSNVTISNVVLNGLNSAGGYRGLPWVNEEGIRILSSAHVTLDNISTNNTYGDGLILGFEPGHPPTTDLTINGYTINKAGRQGVTLAYATASTLNDVTINSSADAGWDFESDLTGIGAGNITINRPGGSKGILMQGTLAGPVTLNDSHFSGDIGLVRAAAQSGQPVTFNRGTVVMRNRFSGTPPAGIWMDGPGSLTFNGVTFGRKPSDGPPKSAAWAALDGAHLTFNHSTVVAPLGVNDAASTVTITP